ncbi:hypothetical protein [Rhizosaccharibacter radicis]|uniref:YfhO family protein n=1 Tax=Rhizosaccharibacter radicis TaxID=2782605 RepID=A0ABT1VVX5_9PROT|nr:YfhO family protein [Acetobacteraceae bacterium KSS12]
MTDLVALLLAPILMQLPALGGWLSADPIFQVAAMPPGHPRQLLPGFPGWIDGNSGATTQALGHLAAEQWLHGRVPWWNHFSGLGMPLAAEMQNSALFLPFVLLLHFGQGVLLLKIAMQMTAGVCMLFLMRELGTRRAASLAAALLFEFAGIFAWFSHGPIMPVPFLPLLVLGIERCCRLVREHRPGGWALIALAVAASLYAGFPETAFLDGLLGAAIAVLRIVQAGRPGAKFAAAATGRLAAGLAVGLLLSAPVVVPFAESLPISLVGQNADFSGMHLLRESYGLLLFPYLLGSLVFGPATINQQAAIWWHAGGYCDLVLLAAGLAALLPRRVPHRGLRVLLACWVVLSLGKAAGVPWLASLFDAVPFIRQTMFYVYAVPGWEFVLILLAGLLLDDLHRGAVPPAATRGALFCGLMLLGLAALGGASPAAERLLIAGTYGYRWFLFGSLAWAVIGTGLFLGLLSRPRAAYGVLLVNAAALFALPILSGPIGARVDRAPIDALRADIGTGRAFSLSRLVPNYGAFFGVPTLNYNYVPVPRTLAERMRRDLDPDMDATNLFGDRLQGFGSPTPNPFRPQATTAQTLERLEALGVSHLLVGHGADPMQDVIGPLGGAGHLQPRALADGTVLSGEIALPTGDASLRQLGLVLGTYLTHPAGSMRLSFCVAGRCETATASLSGVVDNRPLWFDPWFELPVHPGDRLRYRISVHLTAGALALWEVPMAAGGDPAAFFAFRYRSSGAFLRPVFDDDTSTVLRLPHPRPYAEADGSCVLRIADRDRMDAACPSGGRLLRRELFYPGWRATVNGRAAAIEPADDATFQSISLPPGRSEIRFRYAPPQIGWCYGAACLGVVLLLLSLRGGAPARWRPAPRPR